MALGSAAQSAAWAPGLMPPLQALAWVQELTPCMHSCIEPCAAIVRDLLFNICSRLQGFNMWQMATLSFQ